MQYFDPTSSALTPSDSWPNATGRRNLLVALAISVLVHAGLLAWRFAGSAPPRPTQAALEVVLVNARSASAPTNAQAQAQNTLDGGGNATQGMATSPLPQTGPSADSIVLQAMRKRQAQLEAEQIRLLTQLKSGERASNERQAAHPGPDAATPGTDDLDQDSVLLNAQIAALAERVQAYNARQRKQFVSPSTQASRDAAYLDAWRTRIETVGTRYYPDEARGRVYGSLRLTVTVRADGSVASVEIDVPSPHAVLNQAARRIVQMAAPFPPFPPDMARDTDMLVITRTWNFTNDTLETRAP